MPRWMSSLGTPVDFIPGVHVPVGLVDFIPVWDLFQPYADYFSGKGSAWVRGGGGQPRCSDGTVARSTTWCFTSGGSASTPSPLMWPRQLKLGKPSAAGSLQAR